VRWPDGFVCPDEACGGRRSWVTARGLDRCAACGRQTSLTAGTIFAGTRKPLRAWFEVLWRIAGEDGVSAEAVRTALSLGSYQTAWAWLHEPPWVRWRLHRLEDHGVMAEHSSSPFQRRYPPELRERAVRMVLETSSERGERFGAVTRVAGQLGIGPESLRKWVHQAEVDGGKRTGLTTEERARMKELERENRELRRANEILKSAAAFFGAELDRRSSK
jgi:transposase